MANFPRSPLSLSSVSSRLRRAARLLAPFAVLAAAVLPSTADARAGAYDGIWSVVFATTRGNCSSGYSVPFTVAGSHVSSAGGGKVSGSVNGAGAVAVQVKVGASHAGRRRPARRRDRGRLVEWDHLRRPLQRHLAGDADVALRPCSAFMVRAAPRAALLTMRV